MTAVLDLAVVDDVRDDGGVAVLRLQAPAVAAVAAPGHFASVGTPAALLRRPFWIAGADGGTITLRIRPVGPSTRWLAALEPGASVDLLAPLGVPIDLPPAGSTCVLIGQATVPVITWLAELLPARGATVRHDLAPGADLVIASDDDEGLRAVTAARTAGVPCLVATHPPMACGTGLCWTCAVPTPDGPPVRACLEGPILPATALALADAVPAGDGAPPVKRWEEPVSEPTSRAPGVTA